MSTPAPLSLLRKRTGPQKPPIVPGSDAVLPVPQPSTQNNRTKSGILDSLASESTELKQTHDQLVALLDPASEFAYIGGVISSTLDKMTPQGSAVISPVVTDFRSHALAVLQENIVPDQSIVQENTVDQVYDLVTSSSPETNSHILSGLQLALTLGINNLQTRVNEEGRVRKDALNGYESVLQSLANLSETIATYAPRTWKDVSSNPSIVTSDLSQILSEVSQVTYGGYADASRSILATHGIVRDSAVKLAQINNKLQQISFLIAAVRAASSNNTGLSADQVKQQMIQLGIQATRVKLQGLIDKALKKSRSKGPPNMSAVPSGTPVRSTTQ